MKSIKQIIDLTEEQKIILSKYQIKQAEFRLKLIKYWD